MFKIPAQIELTGRLGLMFVKVSKEFKHGLPIFLDTLRSKRCIIRTAQKKWPDKRYQRIHIQMTVLCEELGFDWDLCETDWC